MEIVIPGQGRFPSGFDPPSNPAAPLASIAASRIREARNGGLFKAIATRLPNRPAARKHLPASPRCPGHLPAEYNSA